MNFKADTSFINLPEILAQQHADSKAEDKPNLSSFSNVLREFQPSQKTSAAKPISVSKPKIDFAAKPNNAGAQDTKNSEEVDNNQNIVAEEVTQQNESEVIQVSELSENLIATDFVDSTEILAAPIQPQKLDSEEDVAEIMDFTEAPEEEKSNQNHEEIETTSAPIQNEDAKSDSTIKAEFEISAKPEILSMAKELSEEAALEGKELPANINPKESDNKAKPAIETSEKIESQEKKEEPIDEKQIKESKAQNDSSKKPEITASQIKPNINLEKTESIESKTSEEVTILAKNADIEYENNQQNFEEEGEFKQEALEAKPKFEAEQKDESNIKSIFTSDIPSPKASLSNKAEINIQTKQTFQQVSDHIKSIVSNNNAATGESITTINLNPGNLGQVSVQVITKENHTEIKLLAKEPDTHKLLQEGWKDLVKELETVSSGSDASLSFSLERGNQESQNPAEMYDFFREISENKEEALASKTNSVYDSAKGAVLEVYSPDAGKVNIAL